MASQVLSGTGNFSYTNNTNQVVRVVINFVSCVRRTQDTVILINGSSIRMVWGNPNSPVEVQTQKILMFGKNVSSMTGNKTINTGVAGNSNSVNWAQDAKNLLLSFDIIPNDYYSQQYYVGEALPTELCLNPGEIISITSIGSYNIVVIPENG